DRPQMVSSHQLRSDLSSRLSVFPVSVPALRERADDVPRLVRYFVAKYAARMNRKIETIPSEAMGALARWHWPGNVRELENLMERSVILSRGPALQVPLGEIRAKLPVRSESALTHEQNEREHILRVLRETAGRVSGPDGAATRLGLKRTTLQSKMKKLGILSKTR